MCIRRNIRRKSYNMFRIEKVNSIIKRELGTIILKEIDIFPGILLTITRVESSTNLFNCKVYISVIPEDRFDEVKGLLDRHIYMLQQKLNKQMKMRPVPKIEFFKEKKTAEAGRIEELLDHIRREDIEKKE